MQFDVRFCNNYALCVLRGRETQECTGNITFLDMQGV